MEKLLLYMIPKEAEDSDQRNAAQGLFVRPLEKKAFAEHIQSLK